MAAAGNLTQSGRTSAEQFGLQGAGRLDGHPEAGASVAFDDVLEPVHIRRFQLRNIDDDARRKHVDHIENLTKEGAMPGDDGVQQTLVHVEYKRAAVGMQATNTIVQNVNRAAQSIECDQVLVS
jgi:hypothetical protein